VMEHWTPQSCWPKDIQCNTRDVRPSKGQIKSYKLLLLYVFVVAVVEIVSDLSPNQIRLVKVKLEIITTGCTSGTVSLGKLK